MDNRLLATIIIFPIWLTLILVFRRHRQWLLYYLFGAFGLTLQVVFLAEHFGWDQLLVNLASFHVSLISKYIFHLNIELLSNGRFQLTLPSGDVSILKLGIECSAILESTILVALIAFYPLFNTGQKIIRILFGLAMTYVINICRLMIIVLMAYKLGPEYIFMAHAVVARLFFFAFEIVLYWYLITKPTVKSVGDAIKQGVNVGKTAQIGRSLKFRHALGQMIVVFLVIDLSVLSFAASNEWQKSFADFAPVERPLIYKEETTLIPTSVTKLEATCFDKEITFKLEGGEKKLLAYNISKEDELAVSVKGDEDLAARLIVNGEDLEFVTIPAWLFDDLDSIFDLFKVKPKDELKIKLQNMAEETADYTIKIASKDKSTCQKNSSLTEKKSSNLFSKLLPSIPQVRGASTKRLSEEKSLSLEGGQKVSFKYNITQEEIINISVSEGEEDLAARVIINGDEFGFVTAASWRYLKEKSLFEPISVKPGDVLEIRFQNLADAPADYLIKISEIEEENAQ